MRGYFGSEGTIGDGAKFRMRDFAAYYLSHITDKPLALQAPPMSADYANARHHREVGRRVSRR